MEKLVFVYGTLKSGCWNNSFLGDSELVSEDLTEDSFVLTDCGYPYMVPENDCEGLTGATPMPVKGEVYKVTDPNVMSSLDALEGVAHNHYKHLTIKTAKGYEVLCYIPCDPYQALSCPLCSSEGGFYEWQ